MSIAEYKLFLINKIASISNDVELEDLRQQILFQLDKSVFTIPDYHKKSIQTGLKEASEGKTITNNSLDQEIKKWLKK